MRWREGEGETVLVRREGREEKGKNKVMVRETRGREVKGKGEERRNERGKRRKIR